MAGLLSAKCVVRLSGSRSTGRIGLMHFMLGNSVRNLATLSRNHSRTMLALNPSAVDSFYRMHASRLKLLCKCGKRDEEVLKIVAEHSFSQSTKEAVTNVIGEFICESRESSVHVKDGVSKSDSEVAHFQKLEQAWNLLYNDCLSALETCVEGDLKHFHKARYMLSQGLHRRGGDGDLEKAKEELSFCFKSSRSSFTINMWEVDSTVKEGRYVYQYIQLLERNIKVETLEGINEKIRKRLKNLKLSDSNFARVYRHVSAAWCRSLVISMALITPLHSRPTEIHGANLLGGMESDHLLCVDLQTDELWSSAFEDTDHLKTLETKWNPPLSEIKNVIVKRVADEDLETASTLLRSSYNFYKDTSCALLPSGINLYMVPAQLATETYIQPGIDGLDILDMNTSRKLLLWAYSLSHGHCINVSHVIKYCEENAKSRIKKGLGGSSTPVTPSQPAIASPAGGAKDGIGKTIEPETHTSLPETPSSHKLATYASPEIDKTGKETSTSPESRTGDSSARTEEKHPIATDSEPTTGNKPNMPPSLSPSRDAKSN